ncbi:MAG: 4Fe-4S binding protein [Thermodesulfobacteriota bacterium]
MPDTDVYERLIQRLRTWLFGLPDAEILMPLMQLRFSPAEAEFLCDFPFVPSTMEQLRQRLGLPEETLKTAIKPFMAKGLICAFEGKSGTRYAFTDQVFFLYRMPGWKGEDDQWNRSMASLANRYYVDHFGADFMAHPTKGLRAIPIAQTIQDTRRILPYEDVLAYVEREDYHTVSTCACRHRHNMDPAFETCSHDTETCLHFGKLGYYTVQQGMGRRIAREETLDILNKAADAGLVHGISNSKMGMDTICNCCACCCLFLEPVKMPALVQGKHQRSNYMIRHDSESCKACGLCEKRCPVNAITLKDKRPAATPEGGRKLTPKDLKEVAYDPDQCIGCGVCAHKCPTGSLTLMRRSEHEEDIPATLSEIGRRFLMERGRDMAKVF